mmetsp:Transcript_74071/g.173831  ORF Transcript_74071/g.173831 Transcript_74071/m.173831 type:complete len:310 (+) Transcript_74071:1112-2041(+)
MPVWKCSGQVLIYVLRDERNHGGKANRDVQQHLVEGTQRRERLLEAVATSHPVAIQPNVPVGQIFQEVHQLGHHCIEPVCLHLLSHELDEAMHRRKDPLVHVVRACLDLRRLGRELLSTGALVAIALLDKEAIGVEHRQEDILHDISHALLLKLQRFCSDHTRVQHVHPYCVCPMVLGDVLGIREVLEALGHLLAICGQHQAVDNEVLEGRAVEQVGSQDHERVEPAAGLVETLSDELSRKALLKLLLTLEGVVLGSVRHRSALKPAVENLVDALEHAFALLRRDLDVVYEVAMDVLDLSAGVLLQLGN